MTVPGWGCLTPSQMFMLQLAGHTLSRRSVECDTVESDEERLKTMALGRLRLRQLTGQDFGYDLKRWHEYLLARDISGYQHPYCWDAVRPAIEMALLDEDHVRLVELLEQPMQKLSSEGLAVLLVDALVGAWLIKKEHSKWAVDVANTEIEVRKALGEY